MPAQAIERVFGGRREKDTTVDGSPWLGGPPRHFARVARELTLPPGASGDNGAMVDCLIGLGSNQFPMEHLPRACCELRKLDPAVRVSGFYRSAPVGGPSDQPPFLNAVARLNWEHGPRQLLGRLHQIEERLGRRREVRWGPRTLDLDLLLHGATVVAEPDLQLPHRRMAFRRFVLQPAREIAGEMRHPELNCTLEFLDAQLNRRPVHLLLCGESAAELGRLRRHLCGVGEPGEFRGQLAALTPDGTVAVRCLLVSAAGPLSPEISRELTGQLIGILAPPAVSGASASGWVGELEQLAHRGHIPTLACGNPREAREEFQAACQAMTDVLHLQT